MSIVCGPATKPRLAMPMESICVSVLTDDISVSIDVPSKKATFKKGFEKLTPITSLLLNPDRLTVLEPPFCK